MFGRQPKPPPAPKPPSPPPSPAYWKRVEAWNGNDYPRRETFEHALPDGGMLVMVRYSGPHDAESTSVCYVPPMPQPAGPALRSEPWEASIAGESKK